MQKQELSSEKEQLLTSIQTRRPSNDGISLSRSIISESQVVKSFAKATGDFELLTELDFILMGILYDVEKERNGIRHINQTPLLDVC